MLLLAVDNLEKTYELPAVRQVSLALEKGEVFCLLGPSGCGKTTLLRLIAGLERPDKGRVRFDGRDVTDVPPHQRNFGLMFQEFALFPHKSVMDNVAFGLQMQKQSSVQIRRRTQAMLDLVGLDSLSQRNVADLSGGERQRVAIARALVASPDVVLMDEPTGNLDPHSAGQVLALIDELGQESAAFVVVTHDPAIASQMNRTLELRDGGLRLKV